MLVLVYDRSIGVIPVPHHIQYCRQFSKEWHDQAFLDRFQTAVTRELACKRAKKTPVLALIDWRVKIGGRLWPLPQGFVSAHTRSSPF